MIYKIPLNGGPERFSITVEGVTYRMRLTYANVGRAGWTLDIGDEGGEPIVCGLRLLPGQDLLAQHKHLGINCQLFVKNTEEEYLPPSYAGLGTTTVLLMATAS
jgi:hypothetical protein